MKVTYNWLKDFVQIKLSPDVLAEKLTMAGLEVVSLEEEAGDFVFEIEITSNRPDWLSVIGIAREVCAITGAKFKQAREYPFRSASNKPGGKLSIKIEDKKGCPLYTAKILNGVKVGPSPDWLKERLRLLGCRSVNNIVDITNYILFEYGEPLHAFDLDKLDGDSIVVRRAKDGERIVTIDGAERKLNKGVLVIADKSRPVAVAGVMGGIDTEVTAATANILLEAAVFDPVLIRKGRQALGLQSESSYRFERGVSREVALRASERAAGMIMQMTSGRASLSKSCGLARPKAASVTLDIKDLCRIAGTPMARQEAKNILSDLGFGVKLKAGDKISCVIPDFRQDASSAIDLVEEILRIRGYSRIPSTLPSFVPELHHGSGRELLRFVKETFRGLGFSEVITQSLVSREFLEGSGAGVSDAMRIRNPLSAEQEMLRTSLLPSLLKCVGYNLNQKQDYVNIFEIARVYRCNSSGTPEEKLCFAAAVCGEKPMLSNKGLVREELNALHLKGAAESLFKRLGIEGYSFSPEGQFAAAVYIGREKCGLVSETDRRVLSGLDIKNRQVYCLELYLENIFSLAQTKRKFRPLPKYPGVTRDISFLVREDTPVGDILAVAREKGSPLLESLKISDYYKGKQIPHGSRSLTLSCLYRSRERTLTESEVNPLHQAVCLVLKERFGAQLR